MDTWHTPNKEFTSPVRPLVQTSRSGTVLTTLQELMIASSYMKVDALGVDEQQMQ